MGRHHDACYPDEGRCHENPYLEAYRRYPHRDEKEMASLELIARLTLADIQYHRSQLGKGKATHGPWADEHLAMDVLEGEARDVQRLIAYWSQGDERGEGDDLGDPGDALADNGSVYAQHNIPYAGPSAAPRVPDNRSSNPSSTHENGLKWRRDGGWEICGCAE